MGNSMYSSFKYVLILELRKKISKNLDNLDKSCKFELYDRFMDMFDSKIRLNLRNQIDNQLKEQFSNNIE